MWPHTGSWGLPDFGLTEAIGKVLGSGTTSQGGSDIIPNKPAAVSPTNTKPSTGGGTTPPPSGGSSGGGGYTQEQALQQGLDVNQLRATGQLIDDAASSQQDAARAAAEAKRQAAMRKYQAQAQIAQDAKVSAKGQYDWLIDTLGSNKKDLLDQVTQNEETGIKNYADQEAKTKTQYDSARQEILQTYRDLNREQEKLMRGSGQAQSSRSLEAQMRLNNLMGKDITTISTNEADSLALIGNALQSFKTQTLNTKNSIERETQQKVDKATLDYNDQIKAIDNNLQLSANEREDAYAAAESQLATDVANINTWAAGQKLQAQQTQAALKAQFDDYINAMTDANGLLNSNLGTKVAATNEILKSAGFTPLETETNLDNVTSGVYQSSNKTYKSKEELDSAMASGQVTPLEYSRQLAALQTGPTSAPSATLASAGGISPLSRTVTKGGNRTTASVMNDPLLSAIFA